ncbi:MAG: hypothetical protein K2O58_05405, partial [Bacteroidales bacterium]|nr:hypothetical protein [Bacteroidales bacterium]
MRKILAHILTTFCLSLMAGSISHAQPGTSQAKTQSEQDGGRALTPQQHRRQLMQYTIEDNDTIYL